ncbi:hypothetical protein HBI81_114510 [Parastagonospora nodorum]|nr:hypothetical protein HBI10_135890 [Parastagonospora nodorum]KAH4020568.1 hypothetical protein HBI13_116580 [Parastagonospora nodorum]KAH4119218.1 hypothetical protein HBH47_129350 [Parastagonospora nodorum]KAH4190035.1 hypothetical protein HBI95_221030 [Parastagonospora nodorum]KAH4412665.1 hypothetical protein HBH92_098550 [Parastagonospora nodorum]
MLKILPQGDMYTSLLSGSVETIVQASVNHEQVGEHFAVAWKEIDRIVAATRRELTEFPAPFLLELGIELCCKILEFVTFFFSWYTQKGHKRFLASFNEGLSKDYQPILDEVRQISSFMQRGFQLCMAKNERRQGINFARYFHEVEQFQQKDRWSRDEEQWKMQHRAQEAYNKILSEETRNHLANMSQQLENMLIERCGKGIKQILSREAYHFVAEGYDNGPTHATTSLLVSIEEEHQVESQPPQDSTSVSTKAELNKASRVLDPFFDYKHIDASTPNIECFIELEVVQRLQYWNSDISSSILGICGPASISQDGPARLMASNYVRAAHAAGIPCISFFCEKSAQVPPENRARETIGTVAMMYALIKQLILYLPPEWSEAAVMVKDDFEALDGTLATWTEALSVFRKLLDLSKPPVLLIVIYGLQELDHNATKARLGLFLDLLRDVMSDRSRIVKALLVTAGISEVVYTGLGVDEICDMNRGSAAHSPGRARKGRASMGGVKF